MAKKEDMVKEVLHMHQDMNDLTVDKINATAPKAEETEQQTQLSKREIAKMEGIQYIEPIRKLQAFGKLPEKWQNQHDRDWEYVKGIFENEVARGEPIKFTFSKWPGDPDCMWEIPANRPVYVPRMIARLLSGEIDEDTGIQAMQYHTFAHIEKTPQLMRTDDYMQQFTATSTYNRGKFRAVGAF